MISPREITNRFLTVVLFLVWPFGATLYAGYNLYRNNFRFYFFVLAAFLGLYGYLFNPSPMEMETDLSRIYTIYDILKDLSFKESLPIFIVNGDLSYLFYWVLAHCGFNAQIIGMLSGGFLYGGVVFFLRKLQEIGLVSNKRGTLLIAGILCFMTIHPIFITGVRTPVGFSLFLAGIAYSMEDKNIRSNLCMALAMSIHFFFIILFGLFLLNKYLSGKAVKRICILLLCGMLLYLPLMKSLSFLLSNFGTIGSIMAGKIEGYVLNWDDGGEMVGLTMGGSRKWIAQTVLLITAVTAYNLNSRTAAIVKNDPLFRKFGSFVLLMICFMFFNIFNLIVLSRMFYITNVLCIGFLFTLKSESPPGCITVRKPVNILLLIVCFTALAVFTEECLVIWGYTDYFVNEGHLLSDNLFSILNIRVNY